jgi:translation initiation factor 1
MAKDADDPTRRHALPEGLKHNPFAALRGKTDLPPGPRPEPAPKPSAAKPSVPKPSASKAQAPRADRAASGERVLVRRERKGHGGKAVTVIEGAGLRGRDLEELAREAARGLGAGARVEDGAIVVQGDQADRVVEWLGKRGYSNCTRAN